MIFEETRLAKRVMHITYPLSSETVSRYFRLQLLLVALHHVDLN